MSASSLRGRLAAIVMSACATGLMLNGCSAPITTPTPPAATPRLLNGKPFDVTAQSVDDVRCLPGAKRCVAMDGYNGEFGWAFSGICRGTIKAAPNNLLKPYSIESLGSSLR